MIRNRNSGKQSSQQSLIFIDNQCQTQPVIQYPIKKSNRKLALYKNILPTTYQTQNQPSNSDGIDQPKFSSFFHTIIFIFTILFFIWAAMQNIIFFFVQQNQSKFYFLVPILLFMNLFFGILSFYTSSSKKQLLCSCLLIDTILLTQISASIGFVGLFNILFLNKWSQYFLLINVPLLHFLLSAYFRILLLNYSWNRPRVILFKISLLICSITFFCIGFYIMFTNFKVTSGKSQQKDSKFKDFSLLYTFGNFAFFNQMFSKLSDFDKTSDLNYNYLIQRQHATEALPEIQRINQTSKKRYIEDSQTQKDLVHSISTRPNINKLK